MEIALIIIVRNIEQFVKYDTVSVASYSSYFLIDNVDYFVVNSRFMNSVSSEIPCYQINLKCNKHQVLQINALNSKFIIFIL
jgi:hypothetical protein